MHTSKCQNSIKAGSLPVKNVDYRSVMPLVALVDSQPLSCDYGINEFLRGVQNGMQNALLRLIPERTAIL